MRETLTATVALVRDTFREAFARKVFWGFYGLSTLMILFFLFLLKIDLVEGATATVSLFGKQASRELDLTKIVDNACGAIATFLFTWGLFIAIFASGGLMPSLLEPGRIELLLSKPVSRVHLLLGRFLGNILVVSVNIAYLVLGVWLILGVKTGIWDTGFLWSIVSTIFIFTVLLTVVLLMGVLWESAALSIMVPAGLMILSPVLAQEQTMRKLLSSEWSRQVWKVLYHALPKVFDIGRWTLDVVRHQPYSNPMAVWTSALFACATLGLSLYIFVRRDF